MTWYRLFKKIGNQRISVMQSQKVYAIIEGEKILLDLKFNSDGTPYFAKKQNS